eukprot:TRINITY_DN74696_c0_g1_i1.p1 TRINITY_DN74696_c0_g1~~TRINITY_DN74696_c0_g1_i1.p1  ORF type:complete len:478 (+),score=106.43 TRINITY_DN74696_c0_g1_i1:57-1490(+)
MDSAAAYPDAMSMAQAVPMAQAPWHLTTETHWPGQQCVLAMVVPAAHFQGSLPPGAILLSADQLQASFPGTDPFGGMVGVPAEQFDCGFQGALQQGTMMFQPTPPDWAATGGHGIADESIENTTLGSSSDDGDRDHDLSLDLESEVSASRPRLNTSAARRLRRKRAADRSSEVVEVTAPAVPAVPTAAFSSVRPATDTDFSSDAYELRFKLTEGGRQGVEDALAAIRGKVWQLSCDPEGCRLVQLALEAASQHEAALLAWELHGHVLEAAASPHANFVIQKVVTQLTFNAASFVAEELKGACIWVAQHRFGCRILSRLLEYYGTQKLVLRLVDELLRVAEDLCCHYFAHHVVQSVLEHGSDKHRKRIAAALLRDPLAYATHKHASYLVERALCCCCQEDKDALLATLSHPKIIADLVCSQSGCYVARALLQLDEVDSQAALAEIRLRLPELRNLKHYKRLMADLDVAAGGSASRGHF